MGKILFPYPLYTDSRVISFYDKINLPRLLDYDQISLLTTSTSKTLVIGSNNTVFVESLKKAFSELIVIDEIADLHYQTDKFSLIIFSDFSFMNILDAEDQREAFRILLEKLEHNGEIILNLELFNGDKFLEDPSILSLIHI